MLAYILYHTWILWVMILMFVDDKLFASPIAQDSKPVGCLSGILGLMVVTMNGGYDPPNIAGPHQIKGFLHCQWMNIDIHR